MATHLEFVSKVDVIFLFICFQTSYFQRFIVIEYVNEI